MIPVVSSCFVGEDLLFFLLKNIFPYLKKLVSLDSILLLTLYKCFGHCPKINLSWLSSVAPILVFRMTWLIYSIAVDDAKYYEICGHWMLRLTNQNQVLQRIWYFTCIVYAPCTIYNDTQHHHQENPNSNSNQDGEKMLTLWAMKKNYICIWQTILLWLILVCI